MRRRTWLAGAAATAIGVLVWPGPAASAGTSLGGYTADVSASVVHLEVFEPVIPIPADPQGDVSLGYARSQVTSGPATRATASYLWPGTVIGDGFDQLTHQPGSTYPVQVNSRFPATSGAPAKDTAQLTDGNGMTTATDGVDTSAHVAGLGIAGPHTNLLGGLGAGLGSLGKPSASPSPETDVPVPVSKMLASLVTAENMTSTTDVHVGDTMVTTTATAAASSISVLHGLLGIDGLKVATTITSNGTHATSTGTVRIGALTIAGVPIGLGDRGTLVGKDRSVTLPALPDNAKAALAKLGLGLDVTPVARKVDGATGTYSAQALVITLDTSTLKSALEGPLGAVVALLGPEARTDLAPLLQLKPKLVIELGDVTATTSTAPAYIAPGGGGTSAPRAAGPTSAPRAPGAGSLGGYAVGFTGGGSTGGFSGGDLGAGVPPVDASGGDTSAVPPTAQAGLALPPLGTVPKMLILGGLVLAAAVGWVLQSAGGTLLGAAPCSFGLSKGIPDLRKG